MPTHWLKPGCLAAGVVLVGTQPALVYGQHPTAPCYTTGSGTRALARGSLLHPRDFSVTPFGPAVALHFQTHVTNGVAARMALYDYDFVPGTAQLNYRGRDRVRWIAGLVPHNSFPVVVERLPGGPELAEARRAAVTAELAALLGQVPPDRVVVGPPPGAPFQGAEAELLYLNQLRLTESAGTTPGTGVRGTTSGTSFGGGAGSGFGTGTGGGGLGAPLGR